MKLMKTKKIISIILCLAFVLCTVLAPSVCFAAEDAEVSTEQGLEEVTKPVVELIQSILNVLIAVVGALGAIYCVFLGVKFAKAEEPQDREKAKAHLKNAIIGFVLIFVLIVVLRLLTPVMNNWVATSTK